MMVEGRWKDEMDVHDSVLEGGPMGTIVVALLQQMHLNDCPRMIRSLAPVDRPRCVSVLFLFLDLFFFFFFFLVFWFCWVCFFPSRRVEISCSFVTLQFFSPYVWNTFYQGLFRKAGGKNEHTPSNTPPVDDRLNFGVPGSVLRFEPRIFPATLYEALEMNH